MSALKIWFLPSKFSAVGCSICDFLRYSGNELTPCNKEKKEIYKKKIFVDPSTDRCSQNSLVCDGSIAKQAIGHLYIF
jgi:hypothetical protein